MKSARLLARRAAALLALPSTLLISSVAGADQCSFFSEPDFSGVSADYNLPRSGSHSGYAWGSTSVRMLGADLNRPGNAVYENAESARVKAEDSDVVLYVYRGEDFDGMFQALRCSQGNTCDWRLGSMRNRARSFICQRDDLVHTPQNVSMAEVLESDLLPTALFADPISARIHGKMKEGDNSFHQLSLERGRISWSTEHNMCRTVQCQDPAAEGRRKYRDYLEYSYKARGKLKADGVNYELYIHLWVEPFLDEGKLRFAERGWSVNVRGGAYSKIVSDKLASAVRTEFNGLGDRFTADAQAVVQKVVGADKRIVLFNNNEQLIFSHPCNYFLQRVGAPDYEFSSQQVEDLCGGNTPVEVAAPGLRLLK